MTDSTPLAREVSETEAAREVTGRLEAGGGADVARMLLDALDTGGSAARRRARALLARIPPHPTLLDALGDALRTPDDAGVRNAARSAFSRLAAPRSADPGAVIAHLESLARDADADVRVLSCTALGESENPSAVPVLIKALADGEANVAAAAADGLGVLQDERAVHALADRVHGPDPWLRMAAVAALGCIASARAVPVLAEAVADESLAAAAAAALGEIADPTALAALRPAFSSADPGIRAEAESAAASILAGTARVTPPDWLREALHPEMDRLATRLRQKGEADAALLLGAAGSEAAADLLVEAAGDETLRAEAAAALNLLPADVARRVLLRRLPGAGDERRVLLAALPPLEAEADLDVVEAHLGSGDADVRAEAAEAMARSSVPGVGDRLRALLDRPDRRVGAVEALSRMKEPPVDVLAPLLGDPDAAVRLAVARGLQRVSRPALAPALLAALESEEDRRISRGLARAAGVTGDPGALRALQDLLADDDVGMRYAAAQALGCSGRQEAFSPLMEALGDPSPEVQAAAIRALGVLGNAAAAPRLAERLASGPREVRRTAAHALHELAPPETLERLRAALSDDDREIRLAALRTLRRVGGDDTEAILERSACEDPDPLVRRVALRLKAQAGSNAARDR